MTTCHTHAKTTTVLAWNSRHQGNKVSSWWRQKRLAHTWFIEPFAVAIQSCRPVGSKFSTGFLHQCFIVSTDFKHTVFKLEVWERQPISLVVDEERRCQGDTFIAGGQYCDFPELHWHSSFSNKTSATYRKCSHMEKWRKTTKRTGWNANETEVVWQTYSLATNHMYDD